MRSAITLSIPEELKKDLDKLAKQEGVSRSDIMRESLRTYLFSSRLKRLRDQAIPVAQKQGIFTDEDVFERVS